MKIDNREEMMNDYFFVLSRSSRLMFVTKRWSRQDSDMDKVGLDSQELRSNFQEII